MSLKRKLHDIDLHELYDSGYQILKKHVKIDPMVRDYLVKTTDQKNSIIFNHPLVAKATMKNQREMI